MFSTGGRGGEVATVTNLNASGPGSLADAVSAPNRIVVFAVSGIVDLARNGKGGHIVIAHPNITLAGQTAPGEGICLRGGSLAIQAGNVIIRHLRSRRGVVAEGSAFTPTTPTSPPKGISPTSSPTCGTSGWPTRRCPGRCAST